MYRPSLSLFILILFLHFNASSQVDTANRKSISLFYGLKSTKEKVYPHFLDFQKFGKLHPVIKETKRLTEASGNSMGTFSVKESIFLFGFIPMHPKYDTAVFELEKDKKIKYTSQVKKNLYLEIILSFEERNDSTFIKEVVSTSGSRLTGSILRSAIKKKHLILVNNLRRELGR